MTPCWATSRRPRQAAVLGDLVGAPCWSAEAEAEQTRRRRRCGGGQMRGAGERGQWADRITHTLDVEAPGEYTGRPTPARALRRPPPGSPLRLRVRHRAHGRRMHTCFSQIPTVNGRGHRASSPRSVAGRTRVLEHALRPISTAAVQHNAHGPRTPKV